MATDIELAVAWLLAKEKWYTRYFAYYQGDQPLVYSSSRLKEIFGNINARFSQNWCAVVVDSVLERIQLQRITVADDDTLTARLDELMSNSALVLESADVHLAALVTGESYVIVWPDEKTEEPQAYYNDPRLCHVFYEADRPRIKRFAAKWWIGDDDHRYMNLYYPDRTERYRSSNTVRNTNETSGVYSYNDVTNGKSFDPLGAAERNPWGIVPVFHFRRDRRVISSELQNVIEPQDAVNKLTADMMVAAEFGAFKQRYIVSNADTTKLKNSPSEIWSIPTNDGDEQPVNVGEFDITPLDNYLQAIERLTMNIAIISRTPKHYFFGQGGDPSGEALIAMEAPLNHKAQMYINRFIATWSEIGQFMLLLDGTVVDSNAIVPIFDKPETVQPYTAALTLKENVAAGVPLMWQIKQQGYTAQELEELEAERAEQQKQQTEQMAQIMEQRANSLNRNGGNGARQNGQPPRNNANAG